VAQELRDRDDIPPVPQTAQGIGVAKRMGADVLGIDISSHSTAIYQRPHSAAREPVAPASGGSPVVGPEQRACGAQDAPCRYEIGTDDGSDLDPNGHLAILAALPLANIEDRVSIPILKDVLHIESYSLGYP
jgi:hypothetical protein